jgi:hypothetical protein
VGVVICIVGATVKRIFAAVGICIVVTGTVVVMFTTFGAVVVILEAEAGEAVGLFWMYTHLQRELNSCTFQERVSSLFPSCAIRPHVVLKSVKGLRIEVEGVLKVLPLPQT